MVRAVRPFRSLSMARGCARIDSRLDTVKISLAGRVEVHHARFLAVIGVRKTFPHGLDPQETSLSLSRHRPDRPPATPATISHAISTKRSIVGVVSPERHVTRSPIPAPCHPD